MVQRVIHLMVLPVVVVLCALLDVSLQDAYDKRPQFFPIFPQKQAVYYQAGFQHTKDGIQAAYRNDQRQEYVNNVAYKHGTGLGTAPWYGVPGTAYDFGKSKSAGATYHTDPSHPNGYGYQAPLSQYHSQPSYKPHGGYKAGVVGKQAAHHGAGGSHCGGPVYTSAAGYGKNAPQSASATDEAPGYHPHADPSDGYITGSYQAIGYGTVNGYMY